MSSHHSDLSSSNFVSTLQPSPTLSLNTKAKELAASGADVVNFSVGEPDYPTPETIVQAAIKGLQAGKTKYGPSGGSPRLRTLIAEKFQKENQITYKPEQIVTGIGAKEILFHTFMSMLNEGDEVILLAPYWVSYRDQIMAVGAIPRIVPLPEKLDNGVIDLEGIKARINSRTKAIVLNSPNNPSGYILGHKDYQNIAELISPYPIWVISDEIYEYLSFSKPFVSFLNAVPAFYERTIVVNGLSKAFSMTGFRVGYAAGPVNAIKLIKSLGDHSSTCIPPFIEEAACVALEGGKNIMHAQIKSLEVRRELMLNLLRQKTKLEFVAPDGAFYVFVDLRPILKDSEVFTPDLSTKFCNWVLNEFHLAIVPGEAFGCPGFARLCYSTAETQINKGIDRLAKAIGKAPSVTNL